MKQLIKLSRLVAAVGLVACATKEPEPASDAQPAQAAVRVVEVVTGDYFYQFPDTLTAGLVTMRLHNNGKELHHVMAFRLPEGKTYADFMTEAAKAPHPPQWAAPVGGPNTPAPGAVSETSLELAAGNYAVVCVIPSPDGVPHVAKGMSKALVVTPPVNAAPVAAPAPTVTMTLTDYDFVLSTPLTAGDHLIRVETAAEQPHEVVIAKLEPGKTALELAQWAEKPVGPPLGLPLGGTSAIAKGGYNLVKVRLEPGEYALICFIPDAKDGRPHYHHGMVKQISVS